jgi:hypothetical protein
MTQASAASTGSGRALFGDPLWRRWTLASGLSRLPIAMAPLALVIAGHYATGSFADGALLAGVFAFAEALAAPALGRRLDCGELRRGLRLSLCGGCLGLAALFAGTVAHAPLAALLVATIAAAVLPAAVQGGFRAFVPALLGERAQPAFALDASVLELEWMSAPALVAAVALAGLPYLAVAAMLVATVAAIAATALLPPLPARLGERSGLSAWRNGPALRCYFVSAIQGYTEGTVTVGLAPLLVSLHARAGLAGLVLVLLSAASAVGGIGFSAAGARLSAGHETQANLAALGLGLAALPVALASSAVTVAVAVAGLGLFVAPLNALRTQLLAEAMPAARRSEAFSILYAAFGVGAGVSGLTMSVLIGPLGADGAIAVGGGVAVITSLLLQLLPRPVARARRRALGTRPGKRRAATPSRRRR